MKATEKLVLRSGEGDKKVTEYLRAMEWPVNGWSRENMSIMSAVDFNVNVVQVVVS